MSSTGPQLEQIKTTLQQIQDLWHQGKADDVVSHYASDAILTGEGIPVVVRGSEQLRHGLTGLLASDPDANFDIRIGRVLAEDVAETWITVSAQSSGLALRALLVWVRIGGAWQIKSESFSAGGSF
ncbi:nuclear transport factor 2 family protein [Pseudomonas veronii]|uniref:YybH family protein n=1 Tax=Pseudomonas veronii TaxID=76761 RepID=UPI0021BE7394|nr:nuclear transport factor 2 family protein [Pseudomonas veronii]MCT8965230.1 nuclear transport factor 2 family protein [Pseudomonas veronii]